MDKLTWLDLKGQISDLLNLQTGEFFDQGL